MSENWMGYYVKFQDVFFSLIFSFSKYFIDDLLAMTAN